MKTRVAVTAGVDRTALRVAKRHFTPPCPSKSFALATPLCAGEPRNMRLTSGRAWAALAAGATTTAAATIAGNRERIRTPFAVRSGRCRRGQRTSRSVRQAALAYGETGSACGEWAHGCRSGLGGAALVHGPTFTTAGDHPRHLAGDRALRADPPRAHHDRPRTCARRARGVQIGTAGARVSDPAIT